MNRIKSIVLLTYMEILSHLRVKEAFFFGFVFPVFLYILFGNIWGSEANKNYYSFLLTGVISMTIASDSIFGIGPVMRTYKTNNIIKFLKNLPVGIIYYFIGFFISRIVLMVLAIFLLILIGILVFGVSLSFHDLGRIILGIILGISMFAFLSLNLSFFAKAERGRGILSFVFFIMLFLSGAFYPVEALPRMMGIISNFLPLTHLTLFLRGEQIYFWVILGWILVMGFVFYWLFNKLSVKR